MKDIIIRERKPSSSTYKAARSIGLTHLQADILSRRKISSPDDLEPFFDPQLKNIPSPLLLKNCQQAAERIVRAVKKNENIGLVTDYDVDGLTAHAVAKKALGENFGHKNELIQSFVGNRLDDGYGLTELLCDQILSCEPKIDLVITADCGVSDEKRLSTLKKAGVDVVVTDHHLVPEKDFPHSAYALVNPQQQDCAYPDKALSGCMVCWLVMSAVRTSLVDEGFLSSETPTLISLLDYVALATVADSVSLLSATNRAVVRYGLREMNTFARHCWRSMTFGTTPIGSLTEDDLSYQVSPRINGAGRMADPKLALDFLLSQNNTNATEIFRKLSKNNNLRKEHEAECMFLADQLLENIDTSAGIIIYHPDFHPGILGIIASRLTEHYGVPAIVFGRTAEQNILSGSCRSVAGIHIRDMLQKVDDLEQKKNQHNIISFGGHKGAAGVKIYLNKYNLFRENFLTVISGAMENKEGGVFVEVDGGLSLQNLSFEGLDEINTLAPFGQHFEPPVFKNNFIIESLKFVGKEKNHLKLSLLNGETGKLSGIWFRAREKRKDFAESLKPGLSIECVYKLTANQFRGKKELQLCISHITS